MLASDGVWDVLSDLYVSDLVREGLKTGKTAEETAKGIVDTALGFGSVDNVTALVVYLNFDN